MYKFNIESIQINKLFDIFNYKIDFKLFENVLIITGPNGYGKTTILNIIYNLFNQRYEFFQSLSFNKIVVKLNHDIIIIIEKLIIEDNLLINFSFLSNRFESDAFTYSRKKELEFAKKLHRFLPVTQIGINKWLDNRSGEILNLDELLNEFSDQLPENVRTEIIGFKSPSVKRIFDSLHVHLIKEQRLFKKVIGKQKNSRDDKEETIMIETILTYSKDLKNKIFQITQDSYFQTQNLDSSFPNRLSSEKNILNRIEYEQRYAVLKSKQDNLINYELYNSKQEFLTYSDEDAKALSVYLKDFESKLAVFDSLLQKLELFTTILNKRRLSHKSIYVSRSNGFYFKTYMGVDLELNQLSSGEQHEVVLLYELIFNVKENTLVLVDEPEISLHVTWQKEFLNDLLKIIELQNIQVLIATHSPSIIDERWDLVHNL